MKKKALVFCSAIFFSCSNDNDNNNNSPLRGKWYPRETLANGTSHPYEDHENCGKDYIQFYGSNSIKSVDVFDCESYTDWVGNYTQQENQLTISVQGTTRTFEILSLTETTLSLQYLNDYDLDGTLDTCIDILDK